MTFTLPQILIGLLLVLLFWGGFGHGRVGPGPWAGAWSPLGFTALVLLLLWATGHLR